MDVFQRVFLQGFGLFPGIQALGASRYAPDVRPRDDLAPSVTSEASWNSIYSDAPPARKGTSRSRPARSEDALDRAASQLHALTDAALSVPTDESDPAGTVVRTVRDETLAGEQYGLHRNASRSRELTEINPMPMSDGERSSGISEQPVQRASNAEVNGDDRTSPPYGSRVHSLRDPADASSEARAAYVENESPLSTHVSVALTHGAFSQTDGSRVHSLSDSADALAYADANVPVADGLLTPITHDSSSQSLTVSSESPAPDVENESPLSDHVSDRLTRGASLQPDGAPFHALSDSADVSSESRAADVENESSLSNHVSDTLTHGASSQPEGSRFHSLSDSPDVSSDLRAADVENESPPSAHVPDRLTRGASSQPDGSPFHSLSDSADASSESRTADVENESRLSAHVSDPLTHGASSQADGSRFHSLSDSGVAYAYDAANMPVAERQRAPHTHGSSSQMVTASSESRAADIENESSLSTHVSDPLTRDASAQPVGSPFHALSDSGVALAYDAANVPLADGQRAPHTHNSSSQLLGELTEVPAIDDEKESTRSGGEANPLTHRASDGDVSSGVSASQQQSSPSRSTSESIELPIRSEQATSQPHGSHSRRPSGALEAQALSVEGESALPIGISEPLRARASNADVAGGEHSRSAIEPPMRSERRASQPHGSHSRPSSGALEAPAVNVESERALPTGVSEPRTTRASNADVARGQRMPQPRGLHSRPPSGSTEARATDALTRPASSAADVAGGHPTSHPQRSHLQPASQLATTGVERESTRFAAAADAAASRVSTVSHSRPLTASTKPAARDVERVSVLPVGESDTPATKTRTSVAEEKSELSEPERGQLNDGQRLDARSAVAGGIVAPSKPDRSGNVAASEAETVKALSAKIAATKNALSTNAAGVDDDSALHKAIANESPSARAGVNRDVRATDDAMQSAAEARSSMEEPFSSPRGMAPKSRSLPSTVSRPSSIPSIRVNIGRIRFADTPQAPPSRTFRRPTPLLNLGAYLRARGGI